MAAPHAVRGEQRMRAGLLHASPSQEPETQICMECNTEKPVGRFQLNGRGCPGRRKRCRACIKAQSRRNKGCRIRSEQSAAAHARRQLTESQRLRQLTEARLRKKLLQRLSALLSDRCDAVGLKMDSVLYRARYQGDGLFRVKEIARRWAYKEATGCIRTDGKDRDVPSDGTLDRHTLERLFVEARVCPYCAANMEHRDKTLDHVHPIARGGAHSIANVVVCCRACNMAKSDTTLEEMGWCIPTVAKRDASK